MDRDGSLGRKRPLGGSGPRPLGPLAVALLASFLLPALLTPPVHGQVAPAAERSGVTPPRVFLDCQAMWRCRDVDVFRQEVDFVHWVRNREDADVHVIFTMTGASGGAAHFRFDLIGRNDLRGLDDALAFTSDGRDVDAEILDGLVRTLRLGLFRYAVEKGMGPAFALEYVGEMPPMGGRAEGDGAEAGSGAFYDPWNYWTFRVGLSGNSDIQETRSSTRVNPSLNADRVTEAWKLNLSARANLQRDRRDLSDGTEIRDDRSEWTLTGLLVRSVRDHVSVGIDLDARSSVRLNQHARLQVNPAVEWNYYPYEEAQRRQLIVHYSAGLEHSNYREETALGVVEETLPQHRVGLQYRAREEWGNAGVGLEAAQYLHQSGLYSYGIRGDLSYRIVRGLEVNVSTFAASVNDNIHTPAGAIPDEEILLGRQALPSAYEYVASLGFSYRWGSAFANIVNHRFPRSVR